MSLFPGYSWAEWSLLLAMAVTVIIVPMLLPESLASMRFPSVFLLFIGLASNAYLWQDPFFMRAGYTGWLGLLVAGPAVALMSYYAHGLHSMILTGIGCAYCALWSMLRVFLKKQFPAAEA